MRKFAGSLLAAALLLPAAALAAGITPHGGVFKQTLHYNTSAGASTAKLTVTVARGQITGAEMIANALPYSSKLSHGYACTSVNDLTTKGYKRTGKVTPSGQFAITFANKDATDQIQLVGRFTSATHAKGSFRDRFSAKVAKSFCDTGNLAISVTG
jgi:hypothetical protein